MLCQFFFSSKCHVFHWSTYWLIHTLVLKRMEHGKRNLSWPWQKKSTKGYLKRLPTGFVYVTASHRDKLMEEFRAVSMEKHVKVYDLLIDMLKRLAILVDNGSGVCYNTLTFLILRKLLEEFAEFKYSPLLAVERITMLHLMENILLFGLEYDEKVALEPKIPNPKEKRAKEKKRPRCWNCGEVGHLKRDCDQSSISSSWAK